MTGFRATLRRWCALRGALCLRMADARLLLLACGGKEIRQNSPCRFSDGDRRWMSIRCLDRLSADADTRKDLFRFS